MPRGQPCGRGDDRGAVDGGRRRAFLDPADEVTGGRILAKEGADGFYAAGVRGPVALGLALKIADGSEACRDGVVLEVLRQLGSLSAGELGELDRFYRRPIPNWSGEQVGELAPDLELQEIAE